MVLYSRLDSAADQPAHYQGFGITAKLQCILYRAPEDVDECDSLTLQLGQTQAWYDEIPTLHAGIAKTGELQWVHRLHHREDGQRQTEELLLSQLGNPLGLLGRAELVDAFAENSNDWINFNFKLASDVMVAHVGNVGHDCFVCRAPAAQFVPNPTNTGPTVHLRCGHR